MTQLWISKQGFVTLAASVSLHAAAAAAFVHGSGARPESSTVASTRTPVEVDEELVADEPPAERAEPRTEPESRPATAHLRAPVARATSSPTPNDERSEPVTPSPAPASPPALTAPSPARFVLSAAVAAVAPSSASVVASGLGSRPDISGAPVEERQVSVPARLLTRVRVEYPPEARAQEIETDVRVEIVVDASGRVVSARSLSRAGYRLDEAAERAIRQYVFTPATKDGRAVSVRMRWTVQFRLD